MHNNNIVIIFVVMKNLNRMNEKPVSRERRNKEKELLFYLRYYQELKNRGRYESELDYQIEKLIEKLKEKE